MNLTGSATHTQSGYTWTRKQKPFHALYVFRRGVVRFLLTDGTPCSINFTEPGLYPIAGQRLITRRKTVMMLMSEP